MDAESWKSIGSVLLWIGLFFVMMRYGCGAHMMGRHRHGGGDRPAPDTDTSDPVCGMKVDPRSAAAAAVHGGSTYYFCSVACRDKFEQEPARYLGAPAEAVHHH